MFDQDRKLAAADQSQTTCMGQSLVHVSTLQSDAGQPAAGASSFVGYSGDTGIAAKAQTKP